MNQVNRDRSKLMHKIVQTFISRSPGSQLLLLGCGLDTSFDNYSPFAFAVDAEQIISKRNSVSATEIFGDLTTMNVVGC